jgi:hypothetical protein
MKPFFSFLMGMLILACSASCSRKTVLAEQKLQLCPDEWIENRMPSVGSPPQADQYFILNGERRELKDFDLEWIKKNCSVKPQIVY